MSYQGTNRNKYRQLLESNKLKFKNDPSLSFWSYQDTLNVLESRNDDLVHRLVTTESDFLWLVGEIKKASSEGKVIALDTESEGLDYRKDKLLGLGFCWSYDRETEVQAYVPLVSHKVAKLAHHYLDPLLRSRKTKWLGHNIKYDRNVLRCQWGITVEFYADTLVGAWLQYPQGGSDADNPGKSRQSYGLKQLANRILGVYPKTFKQIDTTDVGAIAKYCCWDSRNTLGIFNWLMEVLPKELINLWLQVESPITNILSDMEFNGIPADKEALSIIIPETQRRVKELDEYITSFTKGEPPKIATKLGTCDVVKLSPQWEFKGYHSRKWEIIYCGRGNRDKNPPESPLMNPFKMESEGDRLKVISAFKDHYVKELNDPKSKISKATNLIIGRLVKGESVQLVCHCAPKSCHAEVIRDHCLRSAEEKLEALRGDFNPGSLEHMKWLLFEKLKFPTEGLKLTTTGVSLNEENIAKLLDTISDEDHLKLLMAYINRKELVKLLGTYLSKLDKHIDDRGILLGATLNQTGTVTGRFSSGGSLSVQTLPKEVLPGNPEIRSLIKARDGYLIVDCDYSQMELRILADAMRVRGDNSLADRFDKGEDVHRAVAALVFEKSIEEVTSEERRAAKSINFGVIYGMGENKLRQMLQSGGMFKTLEWCKAVISKWWEVLVGARIYFSELWLSALCRGYVETPILKRRRYFQPFLHPLSIELRGKDLNRVKVDVFQLVEKLKADRGLGMADMRQLRQAGNAPIQGGNADITKLAMVNLRSLLVGKDCKILTQVHDEIVFECREDIVETLAPQIQKTMEQAFPLSVITPVSLAIAKSWGDCK